MDFLTALARASKHFLTTILANIGNALLGVVIILAIGLIGLVTSIRFYGAVVFGVLAIILSPFIFLAGCLVTRKNHKLGTFLMAAAPIMLIASLIQYKLPDVFPGIVHQAAAVKEALDQSAQTSAAQMETPQRIPCAPPYWIGSDGHARFSAVRYKGQWECYTKSGYHPITRDPIRPLTINVAEEMEQERSYAAPAPPPPEPRAQPTPKPEEWNEPRIPTPVTIGTP